ncbi:hypothetical protein SVIOM74S_02333 [Streptomyces violarus]
MLPPVHSRALLPRDFFFSGRRPRRPGTGASGSGRRRRWGGAWPGYWSAPPREARGRAATAVRRTSQFVFTGPRIQHPLVCGIDVVCFPPTSLRVHGLPILRRGPRGTFP